MVRRSRAQAEAQARQAAANAAVLQAQDEQQRALHSKIYPVTEQSPSIPQQAAWKDGLQWLAQKRSKNAMFNRWHLSQLTDEQYVRLRCDVCDKVLSFNVTQATTSALRDHLTLHGLNPDGSAPDKSTQITLQDSLGRAGKKMDFYASRNMQTHQLLLYQLLVDKQPVGYAQKPGQRRTVTTLRKGYEPPSQFWFQHQGIPALYDVVKQRIYSELSDVEGLALSTDGWKSFAGYSVWSVCVRYTTVEHAGTPQESILFQERQLHTKVLTGSIDNVLLKEYLANTARDWGLSMSPQLPMVMTIDKGSNIQKAVAESDWLFKLDCFSHVMHRAVMGALDGSPSLVQVLNMVSGLSEAMNRSEGLYSMFRSWQRAAGYVPLQTITPCRTRWHGYQLMLARYLELHERLSKWVHRNNRIEPVLDPDRVAKLERLLMTQSQLGRVKAATYVLYAVHQFDALSKASWRATGIEYYRNVWQLLHLLQAIGKKANNRTALDERAISAMESRINRIALLRDDDDWTRVRFAKLLLSEITQRYDSHNFVMAVRLSFFDPQMAVTVPHWHYQGSISQQRTNALVFQLTTWLEGVNDALEAKDEAAQHAMVERNTGSPLVVIGPSTQADTPGTGVSNADAQGTTGNSAAAATLSGAVTPPRLSVKRPGDPRVTRSAEKRLKQQSEQQKLAEAVYAVHTNVVGNVHSQQTPLRTEIQSYLRDTSRKSSVDTVKYWGTVRLVWPRLYRMAKMFMSATGSSVNIEQLWSHAGQINCAQRSEMTMQVLDQLLFLQQNVTWEDAVKVTAAGCREHRFKLHQQRSVRRQQVQFDKFEAARRLEAFWERRRASGMGEAPILVRRPTPAQPAAAGPSTLGGRSNNQPGQQAVALVEAGEQLAQDDQVWCLRDDIAPWTEVLANEQEIVEIGQATEGQDIFRGMSSRGFAADIADSLASEGRQRADVEVDDGYGLEDDD